MEWQRAILKEKNLIQIPESWLYLHYYEALTILFRIENALRVFVFVILKNELKEKWLDLTITSDDSVEGSIKTIARKRREQAKTFGYLGYPITCPLMHLTSGELIRLITSDAYWKYFKDYFLGARDIIKNKLDEIGNIRNSLAHFRPIKEDDVDVVKQNARHVLDVIEKCISEMISCRITVPTNTTEDWYRELNTLGTDTCTLSFLQTPDEEWVKISMRYQCPIIYKRLFAGRERVNYRVLNIMSSAILTEYPLLSNYLTYLSEYTSYVQMGENYTPDFSKDVYFVFSRKTLRTTHAEIKSEIKKLLHQISGETELITQDNSATGKIVQAINTYASLRKVDAGPYWYFHRINFRCDVQKDDPPEFWGEFDVFSRNFVSGTHKYPWMPADISKMILLF